VTTSSAKLFKAITMMQKGKFDAAIALLDKLIKKDPEQAELYNLKATCLSKLGRNEEALEFYEQAIVHMQTSATYWNNKGLVLHNLGRRDEAQASYEHALCLEKDHFLATYNLGNLFIDTNPACAREWYEKALFINPNHSLTLLNVGYLYAEACEYSRAEECYTKALENKDRYAAAAFYRGDLAERLGDALTAITWYEQTLDWDPGYKAAEERLSKLATPRVGEKTS
jgi:tetratricopeptide (TPR) repeat protein